LSWSRVLTIFAVPKPFDGHIGRIQRNAIGSWIRLRPSCQIILCGDEPGTSSVAAQLGVDWIPQIARNQLGTPLLDSVFRTAEERAMYRLLCYVNADILLLSDFVAAAVRVAAAKRRFLMVGRRCDLDVNGEVAFDEDDWETELRRRAVARGVLYPPQGTDYFVYPRGSIGPLPAFAVGRPSWDNWMINRALKLRMPVVDATSCALVIHQNHDHGHVKHATGATWEGPEADANRALSGAEDFLFTLADATHRLTPHSIERIAGEGGLKRRIHRRAVLGPPYVRAASRPLFGVQRIVRRWYRERRGSVRG
jgi:hypothetical protein